ncbi:hypothetical protein G6F43_000065 [Rhizopus delemar]|nr:hypothetical protein G6F43_000065 [Rhizopus delemar]
MYFRSLKPVSLAFISKRSRPLFPTVHTRLARPFHASYRQEAVKSFLLADIGEGITECEVIQWFVEPGSEVNEFDKICEVQSDKASVEISSRFSGKVLKLHHNLHDIAKVGSPLVDIDTPEEDEEQLPETKVPSEQVKETKVIKVEDQDRAKLSEESILATPAVRRVAREKNIDLSKVIGTGKDGRILKDDVFAYADSTQPGNVKQQAASIDLKEGGRAEALNMIQKAMFKSMTQSLGIPQFGYKDDIELDATTKYRAALNKHIAAHPDLYSFKKMTYLPIFIKCLSVALTRYPILNAKLEGDISDLNAIRVLYRPSHNIGIAMDTPQGLIVPNVKDVQTKTIFEIASDIHRLQELAKANALSVADMKGGTITLSNIGTIGGTYTSPVIISSELAIVALGRIQKLPRFDEQDRVVAKHVMPVSWSADHRIIDGATMARFGNYWKNLIENPALLASELR